MEKNLKVGDTITKEEYDALVTEFGIKSKEIPSYSNNAIYLLGNGFQFTKEDDGYYIHGQRNINQSTGIHTFEDRYKPSRFNGKL